MTDQNNEEETNGDNNANLLDNGNGVRSSTDDNHFVVSESEITYSIESFNAVATPVTITMVVSALLVVFINTEETRAAGEEIFARTYQVFSVGGEDQSAAENLYNSLMNSLIIVCVICALTFLVVLCYKYRCMKLFYAYMVLATAGLLGFFTFHILQVAVSIYPWFNPDKLSLAYILYNYAVVGTLAIFLPRGFPKWVTQGYLIAGSVCMAWELSFFNAWMTWCLLVMLALYDLFAVLTPCGPLRALAELISRDGAPSLPGMLYEADLPSGAQRRRRTEGTTTSSPTEDSGQNVTEESHGDNEHNSDTNAAPSSLDDFLARSQGTTRRGRSDAAVAPPDIHYFRVRSRRASPTGSVIESNTVAAVGGNGQNSTSNNMESFIERTTPKTSMTASDTVAAVKGMPMTSSVELDTDTAMDENEHDSSINTESITHRPSASIAEIDTDATTRERQMASTTATVRERLTPVDVSNRSKIPLVLARMHKRPVWDTMGVLQNRDQTSNDVAIENSTGESAIVSRPQQTFYTPEEILEIDWTPQQLATEVTCIFPPRGGRIAKAQLQDQKYAEGTLYLVYGRSGDVQKKFIVTPIGGVKIVLRRRRESSGEGDGDNNRENNEGDDDKRNTIKLGLGDFIFYSLLVSQAAQDSFTAFAACLLVVLMGLAATLVILAVKGKALPALPISIFLGVIAFLWTTTFMEPWIDFFIVQAIYV